MVTIRGDFWRADLFKTTMMSTAGDADAKAVPLAYLLS